jgi:WD40 repeat protein
MAGKQGRVRSSARLLLTALASVSAIGWLHDSNAADPVAQHEITIKAPAAVGRIALSPDGSLVAMQQELTSNGVDIWDVRKRRLVKHVDYGGGVSLESNLLAFSPDGKLFAICGGAINLEDHASIHILDTSSWAALATLQSRDFQYGNGCSGVTFSPDSRTLIRVGGATRLEAGSDVVLFDTTTWEVVGSIRLRPYVKGAGACGSPVSDRLLVDPADPQTGLWPVGPLAVSRDGRFLAVEGKIITSCPARAPGLDLTRDVDEYQHSNGMAVIELTDDKLVTFIHAGGASIAFSPDSKNLAMGNPSFDYKSTEIIRVVEVLSGNTVSSQTENGPSFETWLRYTSDGRYLVTCRDDTIQIWDRGHERLLQSIKTGGRPDGFDISADGRYLAYGGIAPSLGDVLPALLQLSLGTGGHGRVVVMRLH